jgi:pyruvate-formate lyase
MLSKGELMSISTTNNTLQNYITKYIEKAFAAHTDNKYDKLYRELLSKVQETIRLAVSKAKHLDISLNGVLHTSLPSVCVSVCLYVYPPIVARQRLCKNVTAATITHATIKELLDASFFVGSVSYQRKVGD